MTITVKHSKTNSIADWTQSQLDAQIAAGNFPAGTTLANIVLPSDWNNDHTLVGVGTMAEQNANSVAITGGSIDGTAIGATTASTGKFTTLATNIVTNANATYSDSVQITANGTIVANGTIQGEGWTPVTPGAETWTESTISTDTWSAISPSSDTWTEITAGTETWTDITPSNDIWLRQG